MTSQKEASDIDGELPDNKGECSGTLDERESNSDDVISAIYDLLEDSIEDSRSLREERKPLADTLIRIAVCLYFVFGFVVSLVVFSPAMSERVADAPNLYMVLLVILAAMPTLIMIQVAKAVFTKKSSLGDTALTPLEAIVKLMNEMRGSS